MMMIMMMISLYKNSLVPGVVSFLGSLRSKGHARARPRPPSRHMKTFCFVKS